MVNALVDCIRCGKPGAANTLHECAPIYQHHINHLVRCSHCNGVYEQGGIHRCQRGPADTCSASDILVTNNPPSNIKERRELFVRICISLIEHYPGIRDTKRLCDDAKEISEYIIKEAETIK